MESIIQNPALQSGVLPFVLSLLVVLALSMAGSFRAGIAVAAGLALCIALVAGFQLTPLTSTRKIILLALAAFPLGLALDLWAPARRVAATLLAVLATGSVLWLLWPVLSRRELAEALLLGAALAAYGAWQVVALDTLRHDSRRVLGGGLALAFGTGVGALFGASALLGQLGMALGAALAAPALVHFIRGGVGAGHLVAVPVALISALLGVAAHVYAKLPWTALAALALAPLLAAVPWPRRLPDRLGFVLITLLASAASVLAVYLSWRSAGGVPL